MSYLTYFTAEDEAEVSGVLTAVTLGISYTVVAWTVFKGEDQQSLYHFWEWLTT